MASLSTQDTTEEDEKTEELPMVSVREVFRFATLTDVLLMTVGLLAALLNGAAMPLMLVVFGEMTDLFINNGALESMVAYYWGNITLACAGVAREQMLQDPQNNLFPCLISGNASDVLDEMMAGLPDEHDFMEQMRTYALYYSALGFLVWIMSYAQLACWQTASYRQCQKIRTELFRSILRQEIGWFDTHESGELNTRLSDDVGKIQEGIGEKLGQFFQWFSTFITGFIVGFYYGWKLTLVVLAVSPLLMVSGAVMTVLGSSLTSLELAAYARAGSVAEEVFSCVRTVMAFGGQPKECKRYEKELLPARAFGLKKGMINGVGLGMIYALMFACFGLAFWYGAKLFVEEGFSAGSLMVVLFAVVTGAFALGSAAPKIEHLAKARGAAHVVYHIIDWCPSIDSSAPYGILPTIEGNIEFKDVSFNYPSRPELTVLNGLSLKVKTGETVALVGASGCGKSTTVQLLQRFYDVASGQVLIDGEDIKGYNLKWLRQHIGVVSQEPVLFQTSIAENIRYGGDGVTLEEIEKAARMANAHEFITRLPQKYETLVGERGAQLSGGQKQRIAIARALVRDPKILLLDEATSALDTESEATVQQALDKASEGRTTVVIAHRLSTVRNADRIFGFEAGRVVEEGSHSELLERQAGIYHTLYTNQIMTSEKHSDDVRATPSGLISRVTSRTHTGHDSGHNLVRRGSSMLARSMSVLTTVPQISHKEEEEEKEEDEEEEDFAPVSDGRLLRMNAPEWPFIVLGCISAFVCGLIQPAFAVVFAEMLGAFSEADPVKLKEKTDWYSICFVLIGCVNGLALFFQSTTFSLSGACLTMRLRKAAFNAYLRQEVAFYDDPKNNTGALCTRLSTDASAIEGATGVRIGTIVQSLSAVLVGLAIGFVYSWKLTLFLFGFAPFLMVAGYLQMKVMTGDQGGDSDSDNLEEAGKIATEAIENMRTVAALTQEDKFYTEYCNLTAQPTRTNIRKAQVQGAVFGFSQGTIFFAYAACFSFGAYLIEKEHLSYTNMFKVFSAIVFSAQSVGEAGSFAPDYGKAKTAAARVFGLLDRVPTIDSEAGGGDKLDTVSGNMSLKKVAFSYPSRPDIGVLRSLSLVIPHGRVTALVGASGCGKSTVIQMIERFYDPHDGSVNLEEHDLRSLNLPWTRSQMGIVSQEPVLFDCSIRENIAYGDNSRDVPMDEIIQAAKNANIHNFIQTLPEGYETAVGEKGTQLSGGQKQRVAIARALVRNPKILLLDEATSALDTESEKIVQEALDSAQKGRTSVVIAHRLSTIQHADSIVVLENGQLVEHGTHSQLLQQEGAYYRLVHAQVKH